MSRKVSYKGSKKLFKRTALKVHKKNLGKLLARGGVRL